MSQGVTYYWGLLIGENILDFLQINGFSVIETCYIIGIERVWTKD